MAEVETKLSHQIEKNDRLIKSIDLNDNKITRLNEQLTQLETEIQQFTIKNREQKQENVDMHNDIQQISQDIVDLENYIPGTFENHRNQQQELVILDNSIRKSQAALNTFMAAQNEVRFSAKDS